MATSSAAGRINIAATTIDNITKFENHQPLEKLAS
jgi:hypothetical protein